MFLVHVDPYDKYRGTGGMRIAKSRGIINSWKSSNQFPSPSPGGTQYIYHAALWADATALGCEVLNYSL